MASNMATYSSKTGSLMSSFPVVQEEEPQTVTKNGKQFGGAEARDHAEACNQIDGQQLTDNDYVRSSFGSKDSIDEENNALLHGSKHKERSCHTHTIPRNVGKARAQDQAGPSNQVRDQWPEGDHYIRNSLGTEDSISKLNNAMLHSMTQKEINRYFRVVPIEDSTDEFDNASLNDTMHEEMGSCTDDVLPISSATNPENFSQVQTQDKAEPCNEVDGQQPKGTDHIPKSSGIKDNTDEASNASDKPLPPLPFKELTIDEQLVELQIQSDKITSSMNQKTKGPAEIDQDIIDMQMRVDWTVSQFFKTDPPSSLLWQKPTEPALPVIRQPGQTYSVSTDQEITDMQLLLAKATSQINNPGASSSRLLQNEHAGPTLPVRRQPVMTPGVAITDQDIIDLQSQLGIAPRVATTDQDLIDMRSQLTEIISPFNNTGTSSSTLRQTDSTEPALLAIRQPGKGKGVAKLVRFSKGGKEVFSRAKRAVTERLIGSGSSSESKSSKGKGHGGEDLPSPSSDGVAGPYDLNDADANLQIFNRDLTASANLGNHEKAKALTGDRDALRKRAVKTKRAKRTVLTFPNCIHDKGKSGLSRHGDVRLFANNPKDNATPSCRLL